MYYLFYSKSEVVNLKFSSLNCLQKILNYMCTQSVVYLLYLLNLSILNKLNVIMLFSCGWFSPQAFRILLKYFFFFKLNLD